MPCLKILNLSHNYIGCGGAVQLVSSLRSSHLREMNMTGTGISDPDFECLASYIHSTTSLQWLSIGENDISVESIASLCKALSDNSSMRSLDMSDCHLTRSHCECLGQLLRQPIHCMIEELQLQMCSLTSDGVGEVVSGLSDNHALRVLNLRRNQIRSEGTVTLATMLKTNSSLEMLDLEWCSIGSSGGVELGAALVTNKTLKKLRLDRNSLGNDGLRGLSVGIVNNSSLEELYLNWCNIGSSGGVELGVALERNKTLRVLKLSGNALKEDGVRGLCVGLEKNSSLDLLELRGYESAVEEGVSLLLKCVEEKKTSLKRLVLSKRHKRHIASYLLSRCQVEWW